MEVENVVDLYPMIGLQKHGAVADSNFGQYPFKYDIEKEFKVIVFFCSALFPCILVFLFNLDKNEKLNEMAVQYDKDNYKNYEVQCNV